MAVYIKVVALLSDTLAYSVTASKASGGLGMAASSGATQMASLFTAAAQVSN